MSYGIMFYSDHSDASVVGYVDSDNIDDMDYKRSTKSMNLL